MVLGHVIRHLLLMFGIVTQIVLSPGTLVNDDKWHTVFLRRQTDTVLVLVDDRTTPPAKGTPCLSQNNAFANKQLRDFFWKLI